MAKKRSSKQKKGKSDRGSGSEKVARQVYFTRFCKLLKMTGCLDAFKILTVEEKKYIYFSRIHLMQPKATPLCSVPASAIKFFTANCRMLRDTNFLYYVPDEDPVSIVDLLTVRNVVEYFEKRAESERRKEFEKAFAPLLKIYREEQDPLTILYLYYNYMLGLDNFCDQTMYGFDTTFKCRRETVLGLYHYIFMKAYAPRVSMAKIKGKNRPVFQLGCPRVNDGMDWKFIQSSHLGDLYKGALKRLPICLQSHAMHRLFERNKPVSKERNNYFMNRCFEKIDNLLIYQGYLLFAYYIEEVKTGYFLGSLIGNRVVIRTFLFVTHHDTPEGNKLEELSGLTKEDIRYWNIDRLETFIDRKPGEDQKIRKVFEEVGLSNLFELGATLKRKNWSGTFNWGALSTYIQQGKAAMADKVEEENAEREQG